MSDLTEIQELKKSDLELLEAIGISDKKELASQLPAALTADIQKANGILNIMKSPPSITTVTKWIQAAGGNLNQPKSSRTKKQTPVQEDKPAELNPEPVDYEKTEQIIHFLETAPLAIPIPGKIIMENQLKLSDIPSGLLLNRYSGDLDVRISQDLMETSETTVSQNNHSDKAVLLQAMELGTTEERAKTERFYKSRVKDENDRVALIRAPRESTNLGKDPHSRRFIRGVLYPAPWNIRFGAISLLLLLVNLPFAILFSILLLFSKQFPDTFGWVPQWTLVFPLSLPAVALLYFFLGFQSKCRVCAQKIFVRRRATKHAKSHYVPGLGYVVPLSLHLLTFHWFRCSSCGTPIRLKK